MQMLTIIRNQLKLLFHNRIALIAIIAAPLLLTFLYSYSMGSNTINLYLADSDNSSYSKQLVHMLESRKDVAVIGLSEKELLKKVNDGSISVGFVIPKHFASTIVSGEQPTVQAVANYDSGSGKLSAQIMLTETNALYKMVTDAATISHSLELSNDAVISQLFNQTSASSTITVVDAGNTAQPQTGMNPSVTLIGFMAMFLWFVIIQGFRTLIEERENHTFARIQGTPIGYAPYLLSKIVATYLFACIVTAIVLFFGNKLLHTTNINQSSSLAVLFAVYLFALTGISMVFVPFIKKHQTFTIISSVIMALTGILGGSFFSIVDVSSPTMKLISKFTPEAWGIHALTDVALNHSPLTAQALPIAVLLAAGILGFVISYLAVTYKVKAESL